jgi:hypothetical protein
METGSEQFVLTAAHYLEGYPRPMAAGTTPTATGRCRAGSAPSGLCSRTISKV